jgi:hypothetical protein
MVGTVVMIAILVIFPALVIMTGAAGSAIIGSLLKRDRDEAYAGTEHLELSDSNPYRRD